MFHSSLDRNESLGHCTQIAASRRCAIFDHLHSVNAEISTVNLELREVAPGHLELKTLKLDHIARQYIAEANPSVTHLLDFILQRHHCIVSIDIDVKDLNRGRQANTFLIGIVARKVPSLVKVHVHNIHATEEERDTVVSALATAYSLQELHMHNVTLNSLCVVLLHNFFNATERLTTLSLIDVHVHPDYAALWLKALKRNSSIHTLTLALCTCFHGADHGALLATVVARKECLRTLNLKQCCFTCPAGMYAIMSALVDNRHLYGLSLHGYMHSRVFEELIPRMLAQNDALRNLRVGYGRHNDDCSCKGGMRGCGMDYSDEGGCIDRLTQGFLQNKWLEELTVDLSCSCMSGCVRFFEALRRNQTLRKAVVVDVPLTDTAIMYQAMRKNGVESRVTFKCALIVTECLEAVETCSGISHVIINSETVVRSEMLESALALLPQWAHIRRLGLCFSGEQFLSLQALLIPYLAANTALRNLYLNVGGRIDDRHVRRSLLMALMNNRSLQKLHVEGTIIVDEEEAIGVACALSVNRTLSNVALYYSDDDVDDIDDTSLVLREIGTMLRCLALRLQENHTLCIFDHNEVPHSSHYHTVRSVVNRNRALAMCAAHFVMGTNRSDYCANALSLVSRSPQLLFNVMEMASVEEAEAACRIQRTLTESRRLQS
ncbi:uncharacterized protein [Dermacentor albipictus]|uniref:uncharacterized protein n=1 Tax=Dermacentor albipictus TaxID=60249 RepID=UPI0038FC2BEB